MKVSFSTAYPRKDRNSCGSKSVHQQLCPKDKAEVGLPLRGCPSLVGGRPAKPVVLTGRAGSNPAPRAISSGSEELVFEEFSWKTCVFSEILVFVTLCSLIHSHP